MQITYCIDSTNKYKYLEGNRLLSGNIYNPLWAALQWLTVLWCWNLAHCVNAPSNTVTHLFCWQSPVISFTAIRPQNHKLAEYISLCFHNVHTHIVFARLQKQFSSATEHQPPPSYLLFYFAVWIPAASWALKNWIAPSQWPLQGWPGWRVCVCSVSLSSRNLGQRERAYVEGQMRTLDEGLQLKQQLIEEGVLLWREKQVHCTPLKELGLYGTKN